MSKAKVAEVAEVAEVDDEDDKNIVLTRTIEINGKIYSFSKEEATVSDVLASVSDKLLTFIINNKSQIQSILGEGIDKKFLLDLEKLTENLSTSGRVGLTTHETNTFDKAFNLLIKLSDGILEAPSQQDFMAELPKTKKKSSLPAPSKAAATQLPKSDVDDLITEICANFLVKGLADALQMLSCARYAKNLIRTNVDQFMLEAIYGMSSDKPAATVGGAILPFVISTSKGGPAPDLTFLLMKQKPILFLHTKYRSIQLKLIRKYQETKYNDEYKSIFNQIEKTSENFTDGNIDIDKVLMDLLKQADSAKKSLQQNLSDFGIMATDDILRLSDIILFQMINDRLTNGNGIADSVKLYLTDLNNQFSNLCKIVKIFKDEMFSANPGTENTKYEDFVTPEGMLSEGIRIPKVWIILFIQKYKTELFQEIIDEDLDKITLQCAIADCCIAHDFGIKVTIQLFRRIMPDLFLSDDWDWLIQKGPDHDDSNMKNFIMMKYNLTSCIWNKEKEYVMFSPSVFLIPAAALRQDPREFDDNPFISENITSIFSDFTQGKLVNWNDRNDMLININQLIQDFIKTEPTVRITEKIFIDEKYSKIFFRVRHLIPIATSFDSASPPDTGKIYDSTSDGITLIGSGGNTQIKITTTCVTKAPYTDPYTDINKKFDLFKKYLAKIFLINFPIKSQLIPQKWSKIVVPLFTEDKNYSEWLNLIMTSLISDLKTEKNNISVGKIRNCLIQLVSKVIKISEPSPETINTITGGTPGGYQSALLMSIKEINTWVSLYKKKQPLKQTEQLILDNIVEEELLLGFLNIYMITLNSLSIDPTNYSENSNLMVLMNYLSALLGVPVDYAKAEISERERTDKNQKILDAEQEIKTTCDSSLNKIAKDYHLYDTNYLMNIVDSIFKLTSILYKIDVTQMLNLSLQIAKILWDNERDMLQKDLQTPNYFWEVMYQPYARKTVNSSRLDVYEILKITELPGARGPIVAMILYKLLKGQQNDGLIAEFLSDPRISDPSLGHGADPFSQQISRGINIARKDVAGVDLFSDKVDLSGSQGENLLDLSGFSDQGASSGFNDNNMEFVTKEFKFYIQHIYTLWSNSQISDEHMIDFIADNFQDMIEYMSWPDYNAYKYYLSQKIPYEVIRDDGTIDTRIVADHIREKISEINWEGQDQSDYRGGPQPSYGDQYQGGPPQQFYSQQSDSRQSFGDPSQLSYSQQYFGGPSQQYFGGPSQHSDSQMSFGGPDLPLYTQVEPPQDPYQQQLSQIREIFNANKAGATLFSQAMDQTYPSEDEQNQVMDLIAKYVPRSNNNWDRMKRKIFEAFNQGRLKGGSSSTRGRKQKMNQFTKGRNRRLRKGKETRKTYRKKYKTRRH